MFLDNKRKLGNGAEDLKRKKNIDDLYGFFCDELQNITEVDNNDKDEFLMKLLETKEDARNVRRDYFLNRESTEKLLSAAHFTDINFVPNEKNCYLGVITARKPS